MNQFEIEIDGHVHHGLWRTGDYDRLTVESSYGSTYAYRDGRAPLALARSLLAQLVLRSQRLAG